MYIYKIKHVHIQQCQQYNDHILYSPIIRIFVLLKIYDVTLNFDY